MSCFKIMWQWCFLHQISKSLIVIGHNNKSQSFSWNSQQFNCIFGKRFSWFYLSFSHINCLQFITFPDTSCGFLINLLWQPHTIAYFWSCYTIYRPSYPCTSSKKNQESKLKANITSKILYIPYVFFLLLYLV